jgi:glyoxylase I family protein
MAEKVNGIGGLFFKSRDPDALARWYLEHLGIDRAPTSYDEVPWIQDSGPTAFAPFSEQSEQFGNETSRWMVNFRVEDLDAMVAQLRAAGVEVLIDPEEYPNGRFARLRDPEGNPIELWQPEGRDATE